MTLKLPSAALQDRAAHRKGLRNFGKGVILNVTRDGKITYPTLTEEESKNENRSYIADGKVELRFMAERVKKIEAERRYDYEQAMKIVQREEKHVPLFTEMEKEIVRAFITYPKWKQRLKYLRSKGIKKDRGACWYVINKLKKKDLLNLIYIEVEKDDAET